MSAFNDFLKGFGPGGFSWHDGGHRTQRNPTASDSVLQHEMDRMIVQNYKLGISGNSDGSSITKVPTNPVDDSDLARSPGSTRVSANNVACGWCLGINNLQIRCQY